VKVWVYKGDILPVKEFAKPKDEKEKASA